MRFYDFKEKLTDVRRLLLTMILDRSSESLTEHEVSLMEITRAIDDNIARILGGEGEEEIRAAVFEIKDVWAAFKKTRDEEIIPALHDGRFDDAAKLASGVQEERYRKFISIAELVDLSQDLERMVDEKTETIKENFFAFVSLFNDLLELFDPYIGGHCKRVAAMAKDLARQIGLEVTDVDLVETASNLHTIGLIGVPRVVFYREESDLRDRERALIRHSPVLAQGLLSSIDMLKQAGLIIRSHMERYDGTGYPDGLKREEIHIGARILAVCKLYDMVRHRHEHPLLHLEAIEFVKRESGKGLDPEVVNAFVAFMGGWKDDKTLQRVHIVDLKSGMLLASDLRTASDKLLVTKGTRLTAVVLEKILKINKMDPIVSAARIISEG
jgi:response regulator RpfG family c-di-GMP phosphodiesterase